MKIAHVKSPRNAHCPECGSPDTRKHTPEAGPLEYCIYYCEDCAHEWEQIVPEPNSVWDE